jgi:hypothetical protein
MEKATRAATAQPDTLNSIMVNVFEDRLLATSVWSIDQRRPSGTIDDMRAASCPFNQLRLTTAKCDAGDYLVNGIGACGNCHTPKGPDGHASQIRRFPAASCSTFLIRAGLKPRVPTDTPPAATGSGHESVLTGRLA